MKKDKKRGRSDGGTAERDKKKGRMDNGTAEKDRKMGRFSDWRMHITTEALRTIPKAWKFKAFLARLESYPHEGPLVGSPRARSFLWLLVQELQQMHVRGFCPLEIRGRDIKGNASHVQLVGEMVPYTPEKARNNYKALADFVDKIFIAKGEENIPAEEEGNIPAEEEATLYIVEHWLKLLKSPDSLKLACLISRHYAILSDRTRLSLAINLVLCPSTLPHYDRQEFYGIIGKVPLDGYWYSGCITGHKYLESIFSKGKSENKQYVPECPDTKTYQLTRYHRECHVHLGLKERTSLKKEEDYETWAKNVEKRYDVKPGNIADVVNKCCTKGVKKPKNTQMEVLRELLVRFPEFITRAQEHLARENPKLLECLCIDPTDQFPQSHSNLPALI